MNIPKIQLKCSFTRKELYNIYTRFKSLSKLSMVKVPNQEQIGVEKTIFMEGLKFLSLDNTDFLEKIFDSQDSSSKGYLVWDEFFAALKLIQSNDMKDKIELFFRIVDADGNGLFSFEEIKDICGLSMTKMTEQQLEQIQQTDDE